MSILESLELALKNIVSSKVRTLLTMLGIIIGVAAVIVIVGLGNGLEGYVTESFSDMGTNTLTVTVMSRGSTRSLDVEDMYDIVEENSEYLDLCSPTVTMAGYVKIGSETVDTTTSTGVSEDYLDIARLTIAQGRNLQYSDMSTRAKVCVIGAYLNQAYFGGNAVGQTLRVGGQSLEIVGVLAQQDEELEEGGSDDCLYLPYTTAERITGETSTYTITMKDENYIDESVAALEASLYAVFASDDYYTGAGGHRRHLPGGGRHRHYEHHAGVRHRAHPGDRHKKVSGGQGAVHHAAVRHRGGRHQRPGRDHRHSPGRRPVHSGYPGSGAADGGEPHHLPHPGGGGPGLRHLGGHWNFLWIPARQEGGTAQPHRRAALRLIHLGPAPPGPDITTNKECCI